MKKYQAELCRMNAGSAATAEYYRDVMVYVIAVFCVIQFIILLIAWPQKLGHLRKQLGASGFALLDY